MMHLLLLVSVMILCTSAVPQLPEYQYLEAEFGVIPFEIATDTYYPSDWQRINGDPHGQAAEKEAPDALGDETLSFDFPKGNGAYLYLWTYTSEALVMIGNVTEKQLLSFYISHADFDVDFDNVSITVSNATYYEVFSYNDDFDLHIDPETNARVRSTNVLFNIAFEVFDYLFIIIGPGGIYPPVYDVTGNQQQALSVTMLAGDIQQMDALMGQIDGYWIYAPPNPSLGDLALAKADINGVLTPPFVVRRSRHLGRYKECWHYRARIDTHHAILGNLSNFVVPP